MDDISPLERLVLMANEVDPLDQMDAPVLKMISFRVPVELVASVDALANLTGQSRNTTMIDLLRVGVSEVVSRLDDSSRFHEICDHILGE